MKKLSLIIAIVFGLCMTTFANGGGGLFKRGYVTDEEYYGAGTSLFKGPGFPGLPSHGGDEDDDADTPVGTGIALMTALGAAYLADKKRRER